MNTVPMEWATRDIAQGWRGIVLLLLAAIPAIFLALIHFTVEPIPPARRGETAAWLITVFLMPPLTGLTAILVGGSVLRAPQEDGTIIYQLVRPMRRAWMGLQRATVSALIVGVAAMLAGLLLIIPLGSQTEIFDALPGLLLGGLAFGAFYGFLISLHRYAIAAAILHVIAERALSIVPAVGIQRLTLSWHAWGAMGEAATTANANFIIPGTGGSWWVLVLVAGLSLAATAYLYARKPFHLGLPEA